MPCLLWVCHPLKLRRTKHRSGPAQHRIVSWNFSALRITRNMVSGDTRNSVVTAENRVEYFRRIIREYEEADHQFNSLTIFCFVQSIHLPDEVLKYERDLISSALAKADRRVTRAAKLLGILYQTLGSIIESRHPELLEQRISIHGRPRKRHSQKVMPGTTTAVPCLKVLSHSHRA